ncbi:MAG TPA: hypothetical protein PLE30_11510 [Candidatus Kapabacteria bacterium]|nr:hypothetical protein [Candidatus Kapabacteria bacterium]
MEKYPNRKLKIKLLIILIILMSFPINSCYVYCQNYEYIGKDSILIINRMMAYHLDFLKQNKTFEEITFKKYYNHSFKRIYDSLNNLYVPFKEYSLEGDIKAGNDMSGLSVAFTFLADTNINYSLWVFIQDSIYHFDQLTKSDVKKKLFKLNKFGILAFKDTINRNNQDFSEEYKNLLKKLHKKKKKKQIP